jgi:hypothetical protein
MKMTIAARTIVPSTRIVVTSVPWRSFSWIGNISPAIVVRAPLPALHVDGPALPGAHGRRWEGGREHGSERTRTVRDDARSAQRAPAGVQARQVKGQKIGTTRIATTKNTAMTTRPSFQ